MKTNSKAIEVNKKMVGITLIFALVLIVGYMFYSSRIPVKSQLVGIQKIAQEYKVKTGNFGIILDQKDLRTCFAGTTFIKDPQMNEILSSPDVENISCVFGVASGTPVVESWSITIVKGEKAYCEDSTGDRRETPGLTTKETCIAE